MRLFGLIGHPLEHSFSPGYFAEKFYREGIAEADYRLFPLPDISGFPALLAAEPALCGLNVTIPHKRAVMPYLDALSPAAAAIGAVNTIVFGPPGPEGRPRLTGHNTDWVGFGAHVAGLLPSAEGPRQALVLGTGGSARAVRYALERHGWTPHGVSRRPGPEAAYTYAELDAATVAAHRVVVHCTPLGMHPAVHGFPDLPYEGLGPGHLCYDLVYNPDPTVFLIKARQRGAATASGLAMLHGQAEAAWALWNGQPGAEG